MSQCACFPCVPAPSLGERLYPEWIGADDCVDTYGFSVRYAAGGDLELAEHARASYFEKRLNRRRVSNFERHQFAARALRPRLAAK